MTGAAVTIATHRPRVQAGFTVGTLAASLLSLFAVDNLLLLHFGGLSLPLTAGLIFVACTAIAGICARFPNLPPVPYRVFGAALLISLALFALGGEGRFFYANADWQIRDAVLRDMATNPWPFAYDIGGTEYFLRAPLGTYLLPAMFGPNAELALLISNAVRLALLLTLAWHLFESKRERAIVLVVLILFSGWDLVGTALYSALGERLSWDHLERWNKGYQYSSNVTLAFWVPQHAIAGWTCAVAFLLWRKGLAPIGLFAASIPLVAIWSPLAIMGAIPFAIFAGVVVLHRRAFKLTDVALGTIALGISLPALLYLQIDGSKVGMHFRPTYEIVWMACVLFEVLPFVWPLIRERASPVIDRPVILIVAIMLLLMPLVQVGAYSDFQMRASIMPLALLAIAFAAWISGLLKEKPVRAAALSYAAVALLLGAATPLLEIHRALINEPSPPPLCSVVKAWKKQDNVLDSYSTYFAPLSALPAGFAHAATVVGRSDPDKCWARKWMVARQ